MVEHNVKFNPRYHGRGAPSGGLTVDKSGANKSIQDNRTGQPEKSGGHGKLFGKVASMGAASKAEKRKKKREEYERSQEVQDMIEDAGF